MLAMDESLLEKPTPFLESYGNKAQLMREAEKLKRETDPNEMEKQKTFLIFQVKQTFGDLMLSLAQFKFERNQLLNEF